MLWLVSGFMRSGTSMMMSCLEAGGMSVVKSAEREQFGAAHSDEHYKVNAGGLYEPNPAEMNQPGWPKQHDGTALKVVVPWLRALSVHDYRVVFLLREFEEIRQSYEGAFGQKLKREGIERQVTEGLAQLHNRRDVRTVTTLNYADVIANPLAAFNKLRSAGWPIDVEAAASLVNPELYRFRLERLTVGL